MYEVPSVSPRILEGKISQLGKKQSALILFISIMCKRPYEL